MRKRCPIFGSDFALDESSDIKRLLKRYHYTVRELPICENWQDLLAMSQGTAVSRYLSGRKIRDGDAGAAVGPGASVSAGQF